MAKMCSKPYITLLFFISIFTGSGMAQERLQMQWQFDWGKTKKIYLFDSTIMEVLNVTGARYPESFYHLPVVRKELPFSVDSISIEKMELADFSSEEVSLAMAFLNRKLNTVSFKNFKAGGQKGTLLDVIPVYYDSLTGSIKKITALELSITRQKPETQTHLRTGKVTGNSSLATGRWFKLAIADEGVYKIDRSMLSKMGVTVDDLDPALLAVYGNGGKMLPQPNDEFRYDNLMEIAIHVKGEDDGNFDQDDYLLFYAQDPHTHYFDPLTGEFIYYKNVYSDSSFYFLTIGDQPGKRLRERDDAGAGFTQVEVYDDYYIHELDKTNFLYTGREWYGERFDLEPVQNFDFKIPGVVSASTVNVTSAVMAQAFAPASFDLYLNGQTLGSQQIDEVPESTYSLKGRENVSTFSLPAESVVKSDGSFRLSIQYKRPSSGTSKAFLNFFYFQVERILRLYDNQTIFQSLASTGQQESTFRIAGAVSGTSVWDISQPFNVVLQKTDLTGDEVLFGVNTDTLRRFVAFNASGLPAPVFLKEIENQDLYGQPVPDLLIVSYPGFIVEAERLADLRRQKNGLQVLVVTTEQVFNEFSSGGQDVSAIRDYCKYLYDEQEGKLKNLLLFGRGSLDYKYRMDPNTNFVPIYTSRNSLHPLKSYSSDDYYGFMDDDEGAWIETYSGDHMMDIGVGRIPVKNIEEAKVVVNKLYNYETSSQTLGAWRNELYFVADDGDGNLHLRDANRLATLVDTTYTAFNVNKIYLDAYEQIQTSVGESAPEVNEAINEAMDKGTLIVNFTGHGSETRWTSETILNITMINEFDNFDRLPLYVTATCEFGRHDDPRIISGGEYLLLNPVGGAISLVTTSRPVFSSTNYMMNQAFYENVFEKKAGEYSDMGTIFMRTKNGSLNGSINRNFSLLGDPSMKLAYPNKHMRLVLDEGEYTPGDTLKALQKVLWAGVVVDDDNNRITDFKGTARITVYDKTRTVETLGNENPVTTFEARDNVLFRGEVAVDTGAFEVEFIIPKEMDYSFDKGKVSMYAQSYLKDMDANGSDIEFFVGGMDQDPGVDNLPPEVQLYINDTTFRSGGVTGLDIVVLARLKDESGISTTGAGESQGIILTLDEEETFVLNDYYVASIDTYQAGWVTFRIKGLSIGTHRIEMQAADTYNNIGEGFVEFVVVEDKSLRIDKLISAPNPFTDHTSISFEHNRAGDDLEILVYIYSVSGQKVREMKWISANSPGWISGLEWNGVGNGGKPVNSGMYILHMNVRSMHDGASGHASMKLVVIN